MLAGFCFAMASAAIAGNHLVLRGLYEYLQAAAVAAALGLGTLGAAMLAAEKLPQKISLVIVIAAIGSAFPTVAIFPSGNPDSLYLSRGVGIAPRVFWALRRAIDLDRDGHSPVLGGGDCDDLDTSVFPGATEIAGNGRDEDCDGLDANAGASLSFSYKVDRRRARVLAECAANRPTVVLVVDALRADRVLQGKFASLDRLRRQSLWFDSVYAPASSTALSLPAMVTGVPLPRRGTPSVFARLKTQGIRSALVCVDSVIDTIAGKLPVLVGLRYPFAEGFSRTRTVAGNANMQDWGGGIDHRTDPAVTDLALEVLGSPEPPAVMWVHYFDLHQWQNIRSLKSEGVSRYDELLGLMDLEVGRWLDLGDRVNLILTSDHGQGLGQHQVMTHTRYLFRPLIHVPLLIRIPGVAPDRISRNAALTDLAPTIMDLVGDVSAVPGWDSRSLLGVAGASRGGQRVIPSFESRHHSLIALNRHLLRDLETDAVWLFDLDDDPGEERNLAAVERERTQEMLRVLNKIAPRPAARAAPP